MKAKTPKSELDALRRTGQLIHAIGEAEQELQTLSGGQVDAVMGADGRPFYLRDAQQKLHDSEMAQRRLVETQVAILDALPAHIALVDSRGVIVSVNGAWRRFAGANALQGQAGGIGENYLAICEAARGRYAEEAHDVAAGLRRVLRGEVKEFALEYPCHAPAEPRWFRLIITPMGEGTPTGAVLTHFNITERKLAEDVVRESENRYRSLVAATAQIVWVVDAQGQASEPMPEWQEFTGQSFSECRGEGWAQALHPEDRESSLKVWKTTVAHSKEYETEYRLRRHDGFYRRFAVRGVPVFSVEGKIQEWVACCMDITERRRAEESLKLFRALVDQSSDGFEVIDPLTGRYIDVNETACRRLGYTREEMLSMSFADIDRTVPHDSMAARLEEIRKRGDIVVQGRHRRKDGSTFPVEVNIRCIRLDRDYMIAVVRDITERQRVEQERDRLFNLSEDLLGVGSMDGHFELANPAFTRCLGWSALEIIGEPWLNYVHPDDHAATILAGEKLALGEPVRDFENRYRCRDGTYRWLSWNIHPLMESRQIFCVAHDVTERRSHEEQLRLLETCVSRLNDVIVICSTEQFDEIHGPRIVYVNPTFERLTGYTRAEAIGQTPPDLLHGPRTDPTVVKRIHQALIEGKPVRAELMHYTKAGAEYWNEINVVPIFSPSGALTHVVSVERDTTERKQAEEALRQKDTLIRMAGRLTRTGGWFMDPSGRQVFWSDDVCDIMECPHGHVIDLADALALHPDSSRDAVTFAVDLCARDGMPFDLETEIHTVQGRRIWGRVCGEPERDTDGIIRRVWGAFQDITEQKRASEELAKNQALLRVASRVSRLGAWQIDAPSFRVKWSDETAAIHEEPPGFSPAMADAIGYYTPKYRESIQRAVEACVKGGRPLTSRPKSTRPRVDASGCAPSARLSVTSTARSSGSTARARTSTT
jgi:PAS domain S-box-containing protein